MYQIYIFTYIHSSMANYNQCYWASDLPSAKATDAFARHLEELSHLIHSPYLHSSFFTVDWSLLSEDEYSGHLCWCSLLSSCYQHILSAVRMLPASQGPTWRPAQLLSSKVLRGSLFCSPTILCIVVHHRCWKKHKTRLRS